MDTATQRQVFAEVGRRSFWWFLKWGFGVREWCYNHPDDNWLNDEVHYGLAQFLQRCTEEWEMNRQKGLRIPMDIMVMMPRGYAKSTIGCAFDLWLHVRNPNLATVISSYDDNKSMEFLGVVKRYLMGDAPYGLFRSLYGRWDAEVSSDLEWRRDYIIHSKRTNLAIRDKSFKTSSVGRGLTGSRPDVFRLDDPIVREKLTEGGLWIDKGREHLDSSRYAVKTNGMRIVYLTPYVENDVAGKILQEEGVAEIALEGMALPKDRYKENGHWRVFYLAARDYKNSPTLPNVYPEERLRAMEEADPDDYASQMMCNPASGAHMPLSHDDIKELMVEKHQLPLNLQYSIHCDTSFKERAKKLKGDFNVIQLWGHHYGTGKVYYIAGRRSRDWGPREFIENLADILQDLHAAKTPPFVITDDYTMGGKAGMIEEFLLGECRKRGIPMPNFLPLGRTGKAKEARIRQAVFGWKTGKVGLVRGAPELDMLIYEMTRIGYSAHDDMADAAADVFNPQVYMPELGKLNLHDVETPVVRPLDELLWAPPGEWSEDEARNAYDELAEQRRERVDEEESVLGFGVWED